MKKKTQTKWSAMWLFDYFSASVSAADVYICTQTF